MLICSKVGQEVEHAKSNLKTSLFSDLSDLSLASFCQSRAVYTVLHERVERGWGKKRDKN